ncbi:MAG: VWA domain-containing protein [Chitinophagales bacterium]|nr:VWA domain-containing protein [Chitinophagaceae bacterium]MCB9065349.1 VWA domain-containing protein [Chitinophagales bacterium]
MMLRFQEISHLMALILIPVLVALFVAMIYWRRRKLKTLGDERLINTQILGFIPGRQTLRFVLLSLALVSIVIGWANLQMGSKTEKVQRKGVDVIIALDVSKSMLARDIQPNRLARAKQLVQSMIDKMKNDRVGLVVFAGKAYLQVPLTIDYSAMKMMMQNVQPDLVPTQGTVISQAVDLAMRSFSQKEKKYKSLVIISDGEDHDETAVAKVKEAAESGVIIHTVGIGSPQGTTIFDPKTQTVKLDDAGNPVISRLNEDALRSIASAGRGTYTFLRNTDNAAQKIVGEIDGMEQKSLGAVVFTDFSSYFQYFLAVGFLLLIIEWLLPGSRVKQKTEVA